ncbi:cyclic-phosphate processing receiver domain-containing protein [Nocardia sp. NPDC057455]|uniref:cyclic-phosphate processing receiver domain-containing protein n=1 Tax=Nocardia sp. NPDC057455 TaxID=3346138 RepID=UPI003672E6A3
MKLFVDDERPAPDGWMLAKTSLDAIAWLHLSRARAERLEALSLDHDLGGDDTTRPVMLWMCENEYWPQWMKVHSMNPVGCDWLKGMADRYGPGDMVRTWA